MKSKIVLFSLCSVLLLFSASCRKSEIAIKPLDRGDVITASVDMNTDYKQQIFFSLSENVIISTNVKTIWDIGFECSSSGFHLKINTAKAMSVYNTNQTAFTAVSDTIGLSSNRKYDSPTGNLDSMAFGNWQINMPVYIVDRGYNEAGTQLGYKKIQILSVTATVYNVKISNVNGSNEVIVTVPKNTNLNYVYFSFNSNTVVNVEPDKETYDLLFSQYTHIYSNPFSVYLVMGVLINPNKVKIATVFDKPFNEITVNDTTSHPFGTFHNTIGYYWKTYSFQSSSYVINSNMSYIIKDVKGFYYKLHFIDFYNSVGVKGYPKFEFRKL
ncbi:MAG: HmuY family protein [Bacteroidota bacterium]|nr:HmuY family protein [Bacteroidota bacterium]